jgi:hypothetical protein
MLILSQCAAFQPWSQTYQIDWVADGKMRYRCDDVETQDLLLFQQFTTLIPVKPSVTASGKTMKLPDVGATGIPLSTILVAHHNLVTYGVPFQTWTNPNATQKRFYSPTSAVKALVDTDLFKDDYEVQRWYANVILEPPVTEAVPGMSRWVIIAKECFSRPYQQEGCADRISKNWWEAWQAAHPDE